MSQTIYDDGRYVVSSSIVATPTRARLASRWPWIAGALAALLVAPNLAWQVAHGFPSLAFYERVRSAR